MLLLRELLPGSQMMDTTVDEDAVEVEEDATSLRSREDDEAEAPVVVPPGVRVAACTAGDFVSAASAIGATTVRTPHVPDAPLSTLFMSEGRARDGDALIEFVRDRAELAAVRRDATAVAPTCRPVRQLMLQDKQRLVDAMVPVVERRDADDAAVGIAAAGARCHARAQLDARVGGAGDGEDVAEFVFDDAVEGILELRLQPELRAAEGQHIAFRVDRSVNQDALV